jgi:hypothetical protein
LPGSAKAIALPADKASDNTTDMNLGYLIMANRPEQECS